MRLVFTEKTCLGETSMNSTSSGLTITGSPFLRATTRSAAIRFPSRGVLAWAMV